MILCFDLENIFEIKLNKTTLKSNFTRHNLENNHKINFGINKNLYTLNTQNNI